MTNKRIQHLQNEKEFMLDFLKVGKFTGCMFNCSGSSKAITVKEQEGEASLLYIL